MVGDEIFCQFPHQNLLFGRVVLVAIPSFSFFFRLIRVAGHPVRGGPVGRSGRGRDPRKPGSLPPAKEHEDRLGSTRLSLRINPFPGKINKHFVFMVFAQVKRDLTRTV